MKIVKFVNSVNCFWKRNTNLSRNLKRFEILLNYVAWRADIYENHAFLEDIAMSKAFLVYDACFYKNANKRSILLKTCVQFSHSYWPISKILLNPVLISFDLVNIKKGWQLSSLGFKLIKYWGQPQVLISIDRKGAKLLLNTICFLAKYKKNVINTNSNLFLQSRACYKRESL